MASPPLSILKRLATQGQWVVLTIDGKSGETMEKGILLEVDDAGVVLQAEGRVVYEPATDIRKFEILTTPPVPGQDNQALDPEVPVETVPSKNEPTTLTATISGSTIPAYAFEQFSGDISLQFPEPNFSIDELKAADSKELVRWKNQYDNAIRIKEISRIREIIPHMKPWAERLDRVEGYSLCALLAVKVDDRNTARELFHKAVEFADPFALLSLAYLDAAEQRWESAANRFVQSILLMVNPTQVEREVLIALGRCLARLDQKCIRGLGVILEKTESSQSRQTASLLIAFALAAEHPDAAQAALSGNIDLAKSLASGSPIFERLPTPPTRSQQKIAVTVSTVNVSSTNNRSGRVPEYTDASRIPRTASFKSMPLYKEAKSAIDKGRFDLAEKLLREQITQGGQFRLSAIKDLAQLLSRLNREGDALVVLDEHRNAFEDLRPVDNLRKSILVKAARYDDAIQLIGILLKGANNRERINLYRERSYILFRQGRYDETLKDLDQILRLAPSDVSAQNRILRVKEARDVGMTLPPVKVADELRQLAEWTSGLSIFCENLLSNCDFTYVDQRSRARGFFDEQDFSQVERLLDQVRGRRPAERAKGLLNLAAMCRQAPDAAGDRDLADYLRRALAFFGEAALSEGSHPDSARCYLAESLSLATGSDIDFALTHLLATYLPGLTAPGELESSDGRVRLRNVLVRLESAPASWKNFENDAPYYSAMSRFVMSRLAKELAGNKWKLKNFLESKEAIQPRRETEMERLRNERNVLVSLKERRYVGAESFRVAAEELLKLTSTTRFETDRHRLRTLSQMATEAVAYWGERDYVERQNKHGRLVAGLQTFLSDISGRPTKLSVEYLVSIADRIRESASADFDQYMEKTRPSLELRNVLLDDYYIPDRNGVLTLRIEIQAQPGSAPVEELELRAEEVEGLALIEPGTSATLLRGGQCRELEIRVKPSASQIKDKAFTLRPVLRYRTRSGDHEENRDFALPIRIGSADQFNIIPNPYRRYAGGNPIDDPAMFMGRRSLIEQIIEIVTHGAVGQCFVLYGQKRSGKTSVLRQIERQLGVPNLSVEITLGAIDINGSPPNFLGLCLDEIRVCIETNDDIAIDLDWWPDDSIIAASPLETFRKTMRKLLTCLVAYGWENPRLILLIDEFTYLYEFIKEGLISSNFMRNWKAMLQMELFSAVVVGQDSMPKFIKAYENEFGVTHLERISYLSLGEARQLAEDPILLEGQSRYRGTAMERLLALTAGSPFYMQIFCDRLVRYLNERKAPFITEADIELVSQTLTSGRDDLPLEVFFALITAAGESVAEAPREIYLRLLIAIAQNSDRYGGARLSDLPELDKREALLSDLKDREVLVTDAEGRISIRVQLFAEWLRVHFAWQQCR